MNRARVGRIGAAVCLGAAVVMGGARVSAAAVHPNVAALPDGTRFVQSGSAAEYVSWFGASLPMSSLDAIGYSAEGNKAVTTVAAGYVAQHPASDFPAHRLVRVVGTLAEYLDDGNEILPVDASAEASCLTSTGVSTLAVVPSEWVRGLTEGPATDCVMPQNMGAFSLVQRFLPFGADQNFEGGGEPIVGDFNRDGRSDVFWYGGGFARDMLWLGTAAGFKLGPPVAVSGYYEPAVGDFNGDGADDILWVSPYDFPGSGEGSSLWLGGTGQNVFVHGPAIPPTPPVSFQRFFVSRHQAMVGDFNGDGKADVFWNTVPGGGTNYLWYGQSLGFKQGPASTTPIRLPSINPNPKSRLRPKLVIPSIGDFNGDGKDDLLWYIPGETRLYLGAASGFTNGTIPKVYGTYQPVVGDFNGGGKDDVLWYGSGTGHDSLWYGASSGFTAGPGVTVNGIYTATVGDWNHDGRSDVVWHDVHTDLTHTWLGKSSGFTRAADAVTGTTGGVQSLVGDFDGDNHDDIVWVSFPFEIFIGDASPRAIPPTPSDFESATLWTGK